MTYMEETAARGKAHLEHVGVKGMKWGVRNERKTAQAHKVAAGKGNVGDKLAVANRASGTDLVRAKGSLKGAAKIQAARGDKKIAKREHRQDMRAKNKAARKENRRNYRETARAQRAAKDREILKAREDIGAHHAEVKAAKAKYKADKQVVGRVAAKRGLTEARQRRDANWEKAMEQTGKEETQALLGEIGVAVLSSTVRTRREQAARRAVYDHPYMN